MQLYHKTLIQPNIHTLTLALHLNPIKPKQQHQKPKQLLLCKTNSLQLYRYIPIPPHKYQLNAFHHEEMFSNICAIDAIVYQDEDLRKDILILTLSNGKYQLLEWMPNKAQFTLIDQNFVFAEEHEAQTGLHKPTPGHHIAVNNDAKLVLIASTHWQYKLYSRELGYQGIRLKQIAYCKRSAEIDKISICLQLVPGQGNSSLFYSLRVELKEGQKIVKVYKLRRVQDEFQEETITIEDNSLHMIVPRIGEGNFFVLGQKYLYHTTKGKLAQLKIPQPKPCMQTTWWKRPLRQRKQQYFLLNQHGQLIIITFDDTNPALCSAHYVQLLTPSLQVTPLERNLFFLLTTSNEHLLIEAVGKYKCDQRMEKTRSSSKLKEEKDKEEQNLLSKGHLKQFQIVGTLQGGRMIRDMKICNVQKTMNNQILLTGGRPNTKRGFLSIIKYGLKLKSHLSVSYPNPSGIFPLKRHAFDKHHSYIVLSFVSRKTMTFLYDNNKLLPTNQLKLQENEYTLHIVRFGDNSVVQVLAFKLKYISKDGVVKDVPIMGRIMKATSVSEGRQLLLSLVGGFIEYYEVIGGELKKIKQLNLDAEANHIQFAPAQLVQNKPFSRLVALALKNYHLQIYSITNRGLELLLSRNLKSNLETLSIIQHGEDSYCVHVGAHFGKSFKWFFHKNGQHIDLQQQQLFGQRTIKYTKLNVQGKPAIFRISPEPSISYHWQNQPQTCALPLPSIDYIAEASLQGIDGTLFITYYEGYLRFIEIYGFGSLFYTNDKELEYAGRKIVLLEERIGVLMETSTMVEEKDTWVTNFIFLNPLKDYQSQKNIPFSSNEKVLSLTSLTSKDNKHLICFGCVIGHTNYPQPTNRFPCIKIYSYQRTQTELSVNLVFSFPLDSPPTTMQIYFGKLLVGVGRKLILLDIYKQKLVPRAVSDTLTSPICSINVSGQKIFLTQFMESFSLVKLNHKAKCFDFIGQDFLARFTTCACLIDGQAGLMAGGDKFGSFFISKMSQKMKVEFEEIKQTTVEPTTSYIMQSLVNYNLGEVPTAIQIGHIDSKKSQCVYYATIDGRVGMLYPMEGEEEQELILLRKLEEEMAKSSLSGATNHKLYRSHFNPAKGVVDGDFCHLFECLSEQEKTRLTNSLGKEPKDISALLTVMQNKFS